MSFKKVFPELYEELKRGRIAKRRAKNPCSSEWKHQSRSEHAREVRESWIWIIKHPARQS